MGVRVTQTKVEHEGMEFDSKEELGFYLYLKEQDDVSCIHRQTGFVLVEKQEQYVVKHLKTKDKIVKSYSNFLLYIMLISFIVKVIRSSSAM